MRGATTATQCFFFSLLNIIIIIVVGYPIESIPIISECACVRLAHEIAIGLRWKHLIVVSFQFFTLRYSALCAYSDFFFVRKSFPRRLVR